MKLVPIVLFVYNRPSHTESAVNSLLNNELANESEVFIFSDGPKDKFSELSVEKVRFFLKKIKGFKKVNIIERYKNFGLSNSIIDGVSNVIKQYKRVIVLEDDLVCAKYFLNYINKALDFYEKYPDIFSITGYNFPPNIMKIPKNYKNRIYISPRAASWSWATWLDRWLKADWEVRDFNLFIKNKKLQKLYNYSGDDKTEMLISQMEGKIDSWAIRWDYTHFKNNAYCVYPVKSFVSNTGFDGSGVNCRIENSEKFSNLIDNVEFDFNFIENIKLNKNIINEFRKIFRRGLKYKVKTSYKNIINFFNKIRKS